MTVEALALVDVLDTALRAMWPRRCHQEALLDLGERKSWSEVDRNGAIEGVSEWLVEELRLPVRLSPTASPEPSVGELRDLGASLCAKPSSPGVARWIQGLAPAVGTAPKTLANSLRGGLLPRRRDHRWLAVAARLKVEPLEAPVDAWLYHRRSTSNVTAALTRTAGRKMPDAGDALLLFSLLALWQRRRPTERVRGNRGKRQGRRRTPKPMAALSRELASPGQLRHLMALAGRLPNPAPLQLLAMEAALTEAHLAPHRQRASDSTALSSGEPWLKAVEDHADETGEHGRAFRFRVTRMRAWRDQRPLDVPATAPDIPYVRATINLMQLRRGEAPSHALEATDPGILMLLPQLRSRGIEV